jgi:hypothetical protein
MRRWWIANGGPLALVVVGLGIGGFTNGAIGLALIAGGLVWWFASLLNWRCIKFTWSRLAYRARPSGRVSGSLDAVVIPGTPTSGRDLRFATDTTAKRFIDTGKANPPPVGLRFQEPAEQLVTQTPTEVRTCGRLILRVEEFHEHGFVVGAQLPGVDVAAEFSYRGRRERAREPGVVASSDPSAEIVLEVIDDEKWEAWGNDTYIVESPVQISVRKRMRFNGLIVATSEGAVSGDLELSRELHRRETQHESPRFLDGQVVVWRVFALKRPQEGGHRGYEIGTVDELGNEYSVVRPAEGAKKHVWGEALAQKGA